MNTQINWNLNIKEKLLVLLSEREIAEQKAYHKDNKEFKWLVVYPIDYKNRTCGWKLHISANLQNAGEILEYVLPILVQEKACFKVADSIEFLANLNHNPYNTVQAGKFITVYPDNDQFAVKIAELLYQKTQGLIAPRIMTDKQYKNSIVYYRWGSFTPRYQQNLWGAVLPTIDGEEGKDLFDIREPFYKEFNHVLDPFNYADKPNEPVHIVENRYWKCIQLNISISSEVFLAIDLINKQRCIVKIGYFNSFLDTQGNTSIDRVINEGNILLKLNNSEYTPKLYNAFHDKNKNYVLIMEDIHGNSLYENLQNYITNCRFLTNDELYNFANQLIKIIIDLHEKEIIHADLKLQNFLLTPKNKIKVIDFNSACDTKNNIYFYTCGSPGFATNPRLSGDKPEYSDDIYSFGAILYYLASNTDPGFNPLEFGKDILLPSKINHTLDPLIENCILRCLNLEYKSLKDAKIDLEKRNDHIYLASLSSQNFMMSAARIIDNFLTSTISSSEEKIIYHTTNENQKIYDLRGTAGSVLGLSHYLMSEKNNLLLQIVKKNTIHLLHSRDMHYNTIPGLYVGDSGCSLASLYAGLALDDPNIIHNAQKFLSATNKHAFLSVDLFNGLAGRIRTNCIFWKITKKNEYLECARLMYAYLKNTAIQNNNEIYWYNPSKYSTEKDFKLNKKDIHLGYAHGVAGIADAILDYFLISKDEEAVSYINKSLKFLLKEAKPTINNISLAWPDKKDGNLTLPFWCNGSLGIAKLFLRTYKYGIFEDGLEIANKVAQLLIKNTKASLPIQCHGFIGSIEYLLDLYLYTQSNSYLNMIHELEEILEYWVEKLIQCCFNLENPHFQPKDFMTGVPGILSCYIRLANKHQPHILSLEFAEMLYLQYKKSEKWL
jgi:serine/threonine protein kinase